MQLDSFAQLNVRTENHTQIERDDVRWFSCFQGLICRSNPVLLSEVAATESETGADRNP